MAMRARTLPPELAVLREQPTFRGKVCWIVTHRYYEHLIRLNIFATLCFTFLETAYSESMDDHLSAMNSMSICLMFMFLTDVSLKIYALRTFIGYDPYNWLDIAIITISVLPWVIFTSIYGADSVWAHFFRRVSAFRVLRLLRIVQSLSHHPFFKELWMLVYSFAFSIRVLIWGMLLAAIMLIIFATLAYTAAARYIANIEAGDYSEGLFEDESDMQFVLDDLKDRWGSVRVASKSLFTVMTLENWPDTTSSLIRMSEWMFYFFVIVIGLTAYALSNLFTAVLVDSALKLNKTEEEERIEDDKLALEDCFNLLMSNTVSSQILTRKKVNKRLVRKYMLAIADLSPRALSASLPPSTMGGGSATVNHAATSPMSQNMMTTGNYATGGESKMSRVLTKWRQMKHLRSNSVCVSPLTSSSLALAATATSKNLVSTTDHSSGGSNKKINNSDFNNNNSDNNSGSPPLSHPSKILIISLASLARSALPSSPAVVTSDKVTNNTSSPARHLMETGSMPLNASRSSCSESEDSLASTSNESADLLLGIPSSKIVIPQLSSVAHFSSSNTLPTKNSSTISILTNSKHTKKPSISSSQKIQNVISSLFHTKQNNKLINNSSSNANKIPAPPDNTANSTALNTFPSLPLPPLLYPTSLFPTRTHALSGTNANNQKVRLKTSRAPFLRAGGLYQRSITTPQLIVFRTDLHDFYLSLGTLPDRFGCSFGTLETLFDLLHSANLSSLIQGANSSSQQKQVRSGGRLTSDEVLFLRGKPSGKFVWTRGEMRREEAMSDNDEEISNSEEDRESDEENKSKTKGDKNEGSNSSEADKNSQKKQIRLSNTHKNSKKNNTVKKLLLVISEHQNLIADEAHGTSTSSMISRRNEILQLIPFSPPISQELTIVNNNEELVHANATTEERNPFVEELASKVTSPSLPPLSTAAKFAVSSFASLRRAATTDDPSTQANADANSLYHTNGRSMSPLPVRVSANGSMILNDSTEENSLTSSGIARSFISLLPLSNNQNFRDGNISKNQQVPRDDGRLYDYVSVYDLLGAMQRFKSATTYKDIMMVHGQFAALSSHLSNISDMVRILAGNSSLVDNSAKNALQSSFAFHDQRSPTMDQIESKISKIVQTEISKLLVALQTSPAPPTANHHIPSTCQPFHSRLRPLPYDYNSPSPTMGMYATPSDTGRTVANKINNSSFQSHTEEITERIETILQSPSSNRTVREIQELHTPLHPYFPLEDDTGSVIIKDSVVLSPLSSHSPLASKEFDIAGENNHVSPSNATVVSKSPNFTPHVGDHTQDSQKPSMNLPPHNQHGRQRRLMQKEGKEDWIDDLSLSSSSPSAASPGPPRGEKNHKPCAVGSWTKEDFATWDENDIENHFTAQMQNSINQMQLSHGGDDLTNLVTINEYSDMLLQSEESMLLTKSMSYGDEESQ